MDVAEDSGSRLVLVTGFWSRVIGLAAVPTGIILCAVGYEAVSSPKADINAYALAVAGPLLLLAGLYMATLRERLELDLEGRRILMEERSLLKREAKEVPFSAVSALVVKPNAIHGRYGGKVGTLYEVFANGPRGNALVLTEEERGTVERAVAALERGTGLKAVWMPEED